MLRADLLPHETQLQGVSECGVPDEHQGSGGADCAELGILSQGHQSNPVHHHGPHGPHHHLHYLSGRRLPLSEASHVVARAS